MPVCIMYLDCLRESRWLVEPAVFFSPDTYCKHYTVRTVSTVNKVTRQTFSTIFREVGYFWFSFVNIYTWSYSLFQL